MFEYILMPETERRRQGSLSRTESQQVQLPHQGHYSSGSVNIKEEHEEHVVTLDPAVVAPQDLDMTATHQVSWHIQETAANPNVSTTHEQLPQGNIDGVQDDNQSNENYAPLNYSVRNYAYYCEICFQPYPTNEELQRHKLSSHFPIQTPPPTTTKSQTAKSEQFSCRKCDVTFPDRKSLTLHCASHRAYKQCPDCSQRFSTITKLRNHMKMHTKSSRSSNRRSSNLELTCLTDGQNSKSKSKQKHFLCKVCGLKLTSKTKMMAHLFSEHCDELSGSDSEPNYSCSVCNFKAESQPMIDKHFASHPKCEVCDLVLLNRQVLKDHKRIHKTELPVKEEKPLKEEINLTVTEPSISDNFDHDSGHDGDHDFCANYDDDDFEEDDRKLSERLRSRVKNESENVKSESENVTEAFALWQKILLDSHSCNKCLLSFPSKMSLYEHAERVHKDCNKKVRPSGRASNTGPYRCDLCPGTFVNFTVLMDHKLRHRDILPYACKFCCKVYATRRILAAHCNKYHPNELETAVLDWAQPKADTEMPMKKLHNPDYITPIEEDMKSKKKFIIVCSFCKIRFRNKFLLYKHCVKAHMNRTITPTIKIKRSEGSYKCSMCGWKFVKADHMRQHLIRHFDLRSYMCKYCGKLHANSHCLQTHLRQEHGTNIHSSQIRSRSSKKALKFSKQHIETSVYVCDFCNVRVCQLNELRNHIAEFHLQDAMARSERTQYQDEADSDEELETQLVGDFFPDNTVQYEHLTCNHCGMKYHKKHLLVFHIRDMHGTIRNIRPLEIKCKKCDRQFKHKWELKEHELIQHQGIKPYKCKHCNNAEFNNRGSLYLHRKHFHPREFAKRRILRRRSSIATIPAVVETYKKPQASPRTYECFECKRIFKKKEKLTNHIMLHFKIPFKCKLCPVKFRKPSSLKAHYCDSTKYPFLCTCCGKRFKTKPVLLIHRSKHPKNMSCEICGKGFINVSCLIRHKAVYHEAPQFLCPECGSMFSLQTQLDRHLKNHKEMRHACPDCPRKFWDLRQLQQHRNMEHKEKRFICELCGRALSQKWHYDFHMSRHKGERNYGCEECGKSYTSMNALKYHNRTRHPERDKQKKNKPPPVVKRNKAQIVQQYPNPIHMPSMPPQALNNLFIPNLQSNAFYPQHSNFQHYPPQYGHHQQ